ncbi:MAG: hypothetical protein C4278_00825 [Patescibacteria group bacterium]
MIDILKDLILRFFYTYENFKSTIWLYLTVAVSNLFFVIAFIYIAQFYEVKEFGLFNYLFAFFSLFFLLSDFGTHENFVRDYQLVKDEKEKIKLINNAFIFKLTINIFLIILASAIYFVLKEFENKTTYFLIIIYFILSSLRGFFHSFFIARQETKKLFLPTFFEALISLLFLIIFSSFQKTIFSIFLSLILGNIVSVIFLFFFFKRYYSFNLNFYDRNQFIYFLKNGFPLVLFGSLTYIFFESDKIFLAHYWEFEDVAYFSAVTRIIYVIISLIYVFYTAFYPFLSKNINSYKSMKRIFKNMIFLSFLLGSLFSFLTFILSPILIKIIYGPNYLVSISILRLYSLILIPLAIVIFFDNFLVSTKNQILDFYITLIPAFFNIFLNFILIPRFGINGAIVSNYSAQILNLILSFFVSYYVLLKLGKNEKLAFKA